MNFAGDNIRYGTIMSHKTTLEMLRKLAELRSESYEINWEEWEQYEDMMDIEATVDNGIEDYEKKFYAMADEMDPYGGEMDEEQVSELEEIIDTLISSYVVKTMFAKKRAIEEFISSI